MNLLGIHKIYLRKQKCIVRCLESMLLTATREHDHRALQGNLTGECQQTKIDNFCVSLCQFIHSRLIKRRDLHTKFIKEFLIKKISRKESTLCA